MSSLFEYLQKLSNKRRRSKGKNVDPRLLKIEEREFAIKKYLFVFLGILIVIPLSISLFIFSLKFLLPTKTISYKNFTKSFSKESVHYKPNNNKVTAVNDERNNTANENMNRLEERKNEEQVSGEAFTKNTSKTNIYPKKYGDKIVKTSYNTLPLQHTYSTKPLSSIFQKKSSKSIKRNIVNKVNIKRKVSENTSLYVINKKNKRVNIRDFYRYVKLADKSFRMGNIELSIKYYKKAYSIKKDKVVANNLVVLLVRKRLYDEADKLINDLKDERLIYSYIIELVKNGLLEKALAKAIQYIDYDKKGLIYFAKGYVYEKLGLYNKALENYKEAIDRDRNNIYFLKNYKRLKSIIGGSK